MMGLGFVVSAVAGYLCIHALLRFLGRFGLLSFALYRVALAIAIVSILG